MERNIPIIGLLPGDQVWPDAAATPGGGFVVWQDNITDGSGWGVSAMQLNSTLSGSGSSFRVNVQGTNDQENPRVAMLKNGGAAFVWQGGQRGFQQIFARFLSPTNTWLSTNDVPVDPQSAPWYSTNILSTVTTNWDIRHVHIQGYTTNTTVTVTTNGGGNSATFEINPAVAVLNNSNVVVVWGSYDQAGPNSLQDVYGQILSPGGQLIGTNFLINQFIPFNQRTPAVAALQNGGFAVAWVSEQERVLAPTLGSASALGGPTSVPNPSVDIYARIYDSNGVAQTGEFLVNTDSNLCANPCVAAAADGTFMISWGAQDLSNPANSWDIYARPFSGAGVGGTTVRVNTYLYGDQYAPRINVIGLDYMIVWTSLLQDGSREGVYGQFVHADGSLVGAEFRVTTTTLGSQMQPAVASDGVSQFLAVWTGYSTTSASFDLFAQRYVNVAAILQPMAAPFVSAPFTLSNNVYQPQLTVSWPPLLGISVSTYEVYVDGSGTPTGLTASNSWTMTAANGLTASSTHSFQVDYVTTSGARSPLSPSAAGTTWSGLNWYGIPFEWMEQYYGLNAADWPVNVNAPLAPGGLTLYQVFLSGGNPLDPSTWLKTTLNRTAQGMFLSWNTQPGLTYQVQVTTDFASWTSLGAPRFAAGNSDSIFVGGGSAGYYRVMLLRQ